MELSEKIIAIVGEEAGEQDVGLATELEDLELDSLAFVEMITKLEGELGIIIPDSTWIHFETVADVVRFAESRVVKV